MANNIFQDFRMNDDADIFFDQYNGDIVIAPSDEQHIEDILQSFQGDWKQYPMVGVGIGSYLNSSGQQQRLIMESTNQLKADGYTVSNPSVDISDGNIVMYPNAFRQ